MSTRRSDFDVTNSVQVSSPQAVLAAITALFRSTWPEVALEPLERAFAHFERLFAGEVSGFHGVDTVYHDRQHSLDITLALARLLVGYERQQDAAQRLGAARAIVGVLTGLFHDVGYLRRADDHGSRNGAEFTRTHVSRGARFLEEYLPELGFGAWVPITSEIIHFTGYEVPFPRIEQQVSDPRDITVGHLLGTADMIAQIADRCYLEKCRDRLYAEFVLGGVALPFSDGSPQVKVRLRPRSAAPDARFHRRRARQAPRSRLPRGLPLPGDPLRRPAIPIWRRSTAMSNSCARSCAARTGSCCGAARRSSPPRTTR